MRNGAIDYNAVIRDLEQKRAQMNVRFDSAISAIRNIVAAMQQPDTFFTGSLTTLQPLLRLCS